jgi:hypothetical protein
MRAKKQSLAAAVASLERALGEGPVLDHRAWADQLDQALLAVERAVRRHEGDLEPPDGELVEVARDRIPSPGLDRAVAGLQHDLEGFLAEARALRAQLRAATPRADFQAVRRRAAEFLTALDDYQMQEAHVILDAVTTDIGAGD